MDLEPLDITFLLRKPSNGSEINVNHTRLEKAIQHEQKLDLESKDEGLWSF